jgi:hypothetical protein
MPEKGRQFQYKKCRKGLHDWTPENTGYSANGQRFCRTCKAATYRERDKVWRPRIGRARPPIERFTKKYVVDPTTNCWNWVGQLNADRYGVFQRRRRVQQPAHRWSYEHFVGPIPEGLTIDHLCHNTACVNPAHMEAVTNSENVRRLWERRREQGGRVHPNSRKTHCKHGHEFTPENTWHPPQRTDWRSCRECLRVRRKARMG